MPPPRLPPSTSFPGYSPFALAVASALPDVLTIIADGMRTRANIRTAVQAITAGHYLRFESADFIEETLHRYGPIMSSAMIDAYLLQLLRLMDPTFYIVPWSQLLPRR
ncbi:MAG: hypothetical protein HY905_04145 [Deltaproteobacteria bacterium]|nr:hypothetical protein [Deltaproteobacteria bacterium]